MKKPKETSVIINGKPFTYLNERGVITFDNNVPMNHDSGKKLLFRTKELLNKRGIKFCLAFGTLLGAIREHGLIPGDEDLDIFTDQEEELYNSIPWLAEQGFVVTRIAKGEFYSFRIDQESYIDIYILRKFHKSIWGLWCYCLCDCATPKRFFKEYQNIEFLGDTFRCPKNPEKLVAFWYGDDWQTPKSGKKYYYEVKSRYYWRHKGIYIRKFLWGLIGKEYIRKS